MCTHSSRTLVVSVCLHTKVNQDSYSRMLQRRTFDGCMLRNVQNHLHWCKKGIHTFQRKSKMSCPKNSNPSGKQQRAVTNHRRTGP